MNPSDAKYLRPGRIAQKRGREISIRDIETGREVVLATVGDDIADVDINNPLESPLAVQLREFLCNVPWERMSFEISVGSNPIYQKHIQPQMETVRDIADMIEHRGHIDSALAALQSGIRPEWMEAESHDQVVSDLLGISRQLTDRIESRFRGKGTAEEG